jgi:hypothetical protein
MTTENTSGAVNLPAGVAIGPGRETSQTNPQGQVVQGMVFPITLPNGSTTTVFIPYSQITNTQWVQEQFAQRVGSILAITG